MAHRTTIGEQIYDPEPDPAYLENRPQLVYRVWMKDGYAGLYQADSEGVAKAKAIKDAVDSTRGAAMTPGDRRKATTVDYVEQLSPARAR